MSAWGVSAWGSPPGGVSTGGVYRILDTRLRKDYLSATSFTDGNEYFHLLFFHHFRIYKDTERNSSGSSMARGNQEYFSDKFVKVMLCECSESIDGV